MRTLDRFWPGYSNSKLETAIRYDGQFKPDRELRDWEIFGWRSRPPLSCRRVCVYPVVRKANEGSVDILCIAHMLVARLTR